MPGQPCPYTVRIAAGLADPAGHLDPKLAEHLPRCEACRHAASEAVRGWPTDRSPSPSLAEWLSEPTGPPTPISPFQAEAVASGQARTLELGPYLLLDKLGVGGMGAVYRAWHKLLRREDAVKTVKPELASNADAVRRFLREAETAAKLRHPNVVQVYTADQAAGGYYIAMEFVPGSDLRKLARASGTLPVAAACEYVRQAAEGVEHAYQHGLVHRDIKPENLLITSDGRLVKVADFGLARAFQPGAASEMTVTGAVLGTTDYMAPEQADDARSADTRSDIYSLGCTLYSLLTGSVPYPGGSLREKLNRHASAPVPAIEERRPDVGAKVAAIIRKCMAKRPEQRFQTPGELASALRAVEKNEPAPAVVQVAPFALSSGAGEAPTASLPPTRRPAEKPTRPAPQERKASRRWLWLAAGAVTLAVGVVLALQLGGGPKKEKAKNTPEPDSPTPGVTPGQNPGQNPDPKITPGPAPKLPAGVPVPRISVATPWVFTTACWSDRIDKIHVAGFLPDGSICGCRAGWKDDGSDTGYRECWPATGGGKPTHASRPSGFRYSEQALLVQSDQCIYTDLFQRVEPLTLKPLSNLSNDMQGLDRGEAESIDRLCINGKNNFVVGSARPSGEERKIRLVVQWEAGSGKVRTGWQVPTEQNIGAVAVDFTGDNVAAGTAEGQVFLLTTKNGKERTWTAPKTEKGEANAIWSVAVSADGKTIYSAHATEPVIMVWDVTKKDRVDTLPIDWLVRRLIISPDGRWLAAVGYGVTVWDLHAKSPTGYSLADAWAGDFLASSFSSDSRRFLVGGWGSVDGTEKCHGVVWLWDLK